MNVYEWKSELRYMNTRRVQTHRNRNPTSESKGSSITYDVYKKIRQNNV